MLFNEIVGIGRASRRTYTAIYIYIYINLLRVKERNDLIGTDKKKKKIRRIDFNSITSIDYQLIKPDHLSN